MTDDLGRGYEGQDDPAIEPGASAVDTATLDSSVGDTVMTGQAVAAVAVSRPDAGRTLEIQALPGQSYSLDFAPGEAAVEADGADLILIFEDGSRIVFLGLVTLAERDEAPVFTVADAEVATDVLLEQLLALTAPAETALDTAVDRGPQGGGATQYSDNLGDLLDFALAAAQGVVAPLVERATGDGGIFFASEDEIPNSIPTVEDGSFIFDETPGIDSTSNDAVLPAGIEGVLAAAFDSGFPGAGGLPAVKGAANGILAFDADLNGPARAVDFIGYADVDSGLDSGGRASPEDILLRSDPGDSRIVWGIGADSGAVVFAAFIPDFESLASGPGTAELWFVAFQPINHPLAGAQDPDATPDPFDDPVSLVLQYVVTDADGDVSPPASVTLTIKDDGPSAGLALLPGAAIVVDESLGENPGEDETGSLGAVTVLGTDLFTDSADAGSDGQASKVYTLDLAAGASGLTDTASGEAVVLSLVGGVIEGRTETGGELVFAIAVDAGSGDVTLTQFRALAHSDTGDADDSVGLNANLVSLVQTVTDGDGDVDSAAVDLGSVIAFEDDGPSPGLALLPDAAVVVDESLGENPGEDETGSLGAVTVLGTDLFTDSADAGSDGQASKVYTLDLAAGASGLTDTASGEAVVLSLVGGVIEGRTETGGDLVFTISVDAGSGDVTVTQFRALEHSDTGDADDSVGLNANLVSLVQTVTDGDGDVDSAAVDLGSVIAFEDDGPSAGLALLPDAAVVVDESLGENPGEDETGSLGAVTVLGTDLFTDSADAGADGQESKFYTLDLAAGASGLTDTASGEGVVLSLAGGVIEGRTETGGELVFTIAVDAGSGDVTVTLFRALVHGDTGDADDSVGLTAGLVSLVQTVTDGDGDVDSAAVDLGSVISFEDDGPGVTAALNGDESLVHDEIEGLNGADDIVFEALPMDIRDLFDAVGNPGDDPDVAAADKDNGALGFAANPAALVAVTADFGADGAADTAATVYALTIGGADGAVDSGLDTADGQSIFLFLQDDGVVVGRVDRDGSGSAGSTDPAAFAIAIDSADGAVYLAQWLSLLHPDTAGQSIALADQAVQVAVTVTDGDGDRASASVDVGNRIGFENDGPRVIELADLGAPQGFVILGDAENDRAGFSVSSAGDVNGDGFDDLIVGAPGGDDGGEDAGEAYVVFGKAGGFGTVDLSNPLDPAVGFVIQGDMDGDEAGWSVSSAGDINGDGFDDLIVGAPGGDDGGEDAGEAYVVFGKADGFGTVDLAALDPAEGFIIQGSDRVEEAGLSVSSAGDLNGDGLDDLIVGVRGKFDLEFKAAYVVFGKADGLGSVDLAALAPAEGFAIGGLLTVRTGWSVSSAGDINGDGFDDLIVGAPGADQGDTGRKAGEAYVIFGKAEGFGSDGVIDPADLAGSGDGFVIKGAARDDRAGWSVSSAGDVNGDGFDDLIVGAFGADDGGEYAGQAYVVFGTAGGFGSDGLVDLAGLAGSGDGFVIQGAEAFDRAGRSVSSAGDVNGDGFDDLIVGAPGGDDGGGYAGEAYVVFGKADGFGTVDLAALDPAEGFIIQGAAALDYAGRGVSSAGDVNGDGFDDLIVGAPSLLGAGNSGEAYVIFGGAFGAEVTTTGTVGNEILIGGLGDDTLTGGGGADVFRAGAGDDVIVVADTGFARIDGGTGFDTLALDGAGLHLDLTQSLPAEIASIEAIDLTGSGANSLTLSQLDVFDITEERSNGTAILRVTGEAGDNVTFAEIGWANAGSIAEGGVTYDRYVLGNAEVRIEQGVAVSFPQLIDLTGLAVPQGFVIVGDAAGDEAGTSVSSAGDVNGDGFDDIIIGAPLGDDGGENAGEAYVIFGKAGGFGTVDLTNLSAGDGFIILGDTADDRAGTSVSSAGDVNGDGFADLIVGASLGDDGGAFAGEAYVVFGKAGGFGTVDLTALSAAEGFVIQGDEAGDRAGRSVSSAGDVNGDGFDDLIVGAANGDDGGNQAGEAYVIFGKAGGFGTVDLTGLNPADGFVIQGDAAGDRTGRSVSSAGDVNGDGFDDLIVGAPYGDDGGNQAGEAYVIFGKAGGFGTVDLTGLSAADGFVIQGDAAGDWAGISVSSAGDVNGDGFDDLIVGARFGDDGGNTSGEAYVVFGKAGGFGTVDLTGFGAPDGFVIVGGAREAAGYSVSSAGDVNGDGFDDVIVGAARDSAGGTWAGGAYVIFGKADGFGTIDLTNLGAADGFTIQGDARLDRAGWSTSSAGDLNGDGFDDLIVGALYGDDGGEDAGEAYVIFGGAFGGAATPVTTLGTAGNEVLIGGLGDDSLTGGGGADVFRAGAGDDVIVVADTGFARIDGGSGFDTLALDSAGLHLDLTQSLPAEIASIEAIDLTGSGANSLTLSQLNVFDITEERSNGTAILRVTGEAGDGVTFAEVGWANAGSIAEGGVTYDRYVLGNAEVRVEQGVAVSFPPVIDLTGLAVPQGFIIQGDAAGDEAGTGVSSAGDVNGDGFDDVIVGAPRGDDGGERAGEAYVVFGKAGGFGTVDLSALAPADGFVIQGDREFDRAGQGVSSAGDVDGDGFDDLIVSASGKAYVVFGKVGGFGTVDLTTITAADGFVIRGGGLGGSSVSSAGDVDGDGFDDLIVGAIGSSVGGLLEGGAYVVFGKAGGFGTVDLSTLGAADGFAIRGDAELDLAGRSVSSAGDVNGDGFDDLIVGAPQGDDGGNYAGEAYVVFGKAGGFGTIDLGALAPADGFVIQGDRSQDYAGWSVSSAGDVDGDGFDDLIVGAPFGRDGGSLAGEAYVIFGKAGGFGTVDLTGLSAADGFVIRGANTDRAGFSVSSAGDVDGDGFDDLIVGAPFGDGGFLAGEAYVVFGKAGGFGTIDLSALAPAEGFVIQGDASGDRAGGSVSAAGDVNGDGFDDLIVGARYGDDGGGKAGEAYVVFGGAFGGSTAPVTTVGTGGNEILIGGLGDDTLTGGGGADVFRAGAGDDVIVVADTGFARIDGGSGFDTLALDGAGLDLDFTAIDSSSKVTDIEAVDLTGSGDNSLALNVQDLLQLSDETSDLFVFGDTGDTVALAGDFVADGTAEVDGTTYNVYISAGTEARLLAETDVTVETS